MGSIFPGLVFIRPPLNVRSSSRGRGIRTIDLREIEIRRMALNCWAGVVTPVFGSISDRVNGRAFGPIGSPVATGISILAPPSGDRSMS